MSSSLDQAILAQLATFSASVGTDCDTTTEHIVRKLSTVLQSVPGIQAVDDRGRAQHIKPVQLGDGHWISLEVEDEVLYERYKVFVDAAFTTTRLVIERNEREARQHKNNENTDVRVAGVAKQLEETKKHEAIILKRLELATQSANIGVWEWDLVENVLKWDEKMFHIYGVDTKKADSTAYELWSQHLHPDDKQDTEERVTLAVSGEAPFDCDFRIVKDNGDVRTIKASAVVLRDEDSTPLSMIGVNFDITEQKDLEFQQENAKREAEEASRAKSEFLATMSHEIRTPMNGVLGMLHLVLQSDIDTKNRKKLDIALNSAKSLLTIINDILDFSKIEAGKLQIEETEFNLVDVFETTLNNYVAPLAEKKLDFYCDLSNVMHKELYGDPTRISQIVNNLISNAIKFTENGRVILSASTLEMDSSGRIFLVCSVEDNGAGIPKEKVNELFSSFTQVDASTTRKFGGTGLGLAICKRLCLLMGGKIEVSSVEGKGSNFTFTLPLTVNHNKSSTPSMTFEGEVAIQINDEYDKKSVIPLLQGWFRGVDTYSCLADIISVEKCYNLVVVDDDTLFSASDAVINTLCKRSEKVLALSKHVEASFNEYSRSGFIRINKPVFTGDLRDAVNAASNRPKKIDAEHVVHGDISSKRKENYHRSNVDGCRILVVDDNDINQDVAIGLLEDFNVECDKAFNGKEAIEKLNEEKTHYDLVLMDCQMPEMNGYEATQNIRNGACGEPNKRIPIVAMTANAMAGDREECIASGMDDYISKPICPDSMTSVLSRWVRLSSRHNENPACESEHDNLSDEPVWDKSSALARVRNREDRLAKLITIFIKESDARISEFTMAVENRNYERIGDLAHGLKGVSSNLSCIRMQICAGELEKSAKTNGDDIEVMWRNLNASISETMPLLFEFVENKK